MEGWVQFYSVTAVAAATLLGLLFVAVSISAAAILSEAYENTKRLAEQAFQNYLAVMMVSLLALFPSLDLSGFGFATLGVTALSSVWVLVRLCLALVRPHEPGSRLQSLRRQFTSLVGFGMLIFASVRMAFELGDSRNVFAAAVLILLFSATAVSWGLLLRIAEAKPI